MESKLDELRHCMPDECPGASMAAGENFPVVRCPVDKQLYKPNDTCHYGKLPPVQSPKKMDDSTLRNSIQKRYDSCPHH